MNYIPAIYFSILTGILFMKRGLDACTYISLIYTATSLFAVGIDIMGLSPNLVSFASLLPTILYCLLLTLFIVPVYFIDLSAYKGIKFRSQKFLRLVTYAYFASLVCFLLAYMNDLKFIISYGDFGELKNLVYEGDAYQLTSYPSIIELFLYPVRVIVGSSVIMIFIFFFNITFLKEKWWINVMAVVSSGSVIVDGILHIDRSSTFFWVLLLGLSVSMFWNFMQPKIKSIAIGFTTVLVLAAATYALAVTKDRFEDRDGGSEGGIVMYLGQPYYHFCEIWDYYPAPDGITTKSLFPSLHVFLLKDYAGAVAYQQEMGLKTNMDLGVFYTHLGSFMLSAGNFGPFMITIVYLLVFYLIMKDDNSMPSKKGKDSNYFPFEKLMIIYFLLCIPTVGCICYYYENYYVEAFTYLTIGALFYFKDDDLKLLTKRIQNKAKANLHLE